MENYGQGSSLKNLKKMANIFMLAMAGIAFPVIFFVGCDTGGGSGTDNTNRGESFNEVAFRAWANDPERSLALDGGTPVSFTDVFIDNATAFARNNWNNNEYRNNATTFNRLTVKFAETIWPGHQPIITKGREFACTKNILGAYMRGTIVYG